MVSEIARTAGIRHTTYHPYPRITDREAWLALPQMLREQLVGAGETYLSYTFPPLTATDFMRFSRTGNRTIYEEVMFQKRWALNCLTLAECIENQGRFLDPILNGIYSLCEESAWQLPAHNAYERDAIQLPLPDPERPVLDLFAAETGAVLAVVLWLLEDSLNALSPVVGKMIKARLNQRIFRPYLEEHFWWMGDGQSPLNNWTVWCTQNVLLAAFSGAAGPEDQSKVYHKACQSLDYFLADYGEDGCCDEGAGYYRHAALCLFGCLEILNGITGQAFVTLYETKKIRNMAEYIRNVHVDGIYYFNFADCSPVPGRCTAREYLFGKKVKSPGLTAFAAADYKDNDDPLLLRENNLFYRLQTIFHYQEMIAASEDIPKPAPDLFYESTGLLIARDSRLCLAVKAGDNDDSHNHNDTGSFTVYCDGKPLFIDVGVGSYTKKTFSPDRYEIWTMQSSYHNLPEIGGSMQQNGPEFKAENVRYSFSDDICQISMEIGAAYKVPGIQSYQREVTFAKEHGITIIDTYRGDQRPVILSLMTYDQPVIENNLLKIGSNGTCLIKGAVTIATEAIPINDPRLMQAWKHEIYRTRITMETNRLELEISGS